MEPEPVPVTLLEPDPELEGEAETDDDETVGRVTESEALEIEAVELAVLFAGARTCKLRSCTQARRT